MPRLARKFDLVEMARQELGMSLAQANVETKTFLKEKIRIARAMKNSPDEPLASTPPGLRRMPKGLLGAFSRMRLTELRDEVHKRGLPVIPNATKTQMQMQIQEHAQMQLEQGEVGSFTAPRQFRRIPWGPWKLAPLYLSLIHI